MKNNKKKPKSKLIALRLPMDLYEKIQKVRRHDESQSQAIFHLLREALKNE
jgi:hypothetical protein